MRPRPSQANPAGSSGIDRPSESRNASPLAIIIIPSVTMNGGSRNSVISTPLRDPAAAHRLVPTSAASTIAAGPACAPPPQSRSSRAVLTDDSATSDPTERSIPPVTITSVIPIAISA